MGKKVALPVSLPAALPAAVQAAVAYGEVLNTTLAIKNGVDLSGVTAEQIAAILAQATPGIERAKKAKDAAAKLAKTVGKLTKGLSITPLTEDDAEFNIVAQGYYGLPSKTSIEWGVVQTEKGFRYRVGHGCIFRVNGSTGTDSKKFRRDQKDWIIDGGCDLVMNTMEAAVMEAVKNGREWFKRTTTAQAQAQALADAASAANENDSEE